MPALQNEKHELFCQALFRGATIAAAYIEAGYTESKGSARANGCRLKAQPKIAARVRELIETADTLDMPLRLGWIQDQLALLLIGDPLDMYMDDPEDPGRTVLKPMSAIPQHLRRAITKIRHDAATGRPTEVILVDKVSAANALLKTIPGGTNLRAEISGVNGSPIEVTIGHLVDRLYSPNVLQNADTETLEALSQAQAVLRLIADKTVQRPSNEAGETIDAEYAEVGDVD